MNYYNHVMLGEPKENPRIDVQKAVRLWNDEQYKMIMVAAAEPEKSNVNTPSPKKIQVASSAQPTSP